jgi:hypothetical protein
MNKSAKKQNINQYTNMGRLLLLRRNHVPEVKAKLQALFVACTPISSIFCPS